MDYAMSGADMAYPNKSADVQSFGGAQAHRIARPGSRPLTFSGTELAMAMSFTPELPYWYELNIYRTDGQRFVLVVKQFFQSEDEEDRKNAWEFGSLPEVFEALESYDAARDVKMDAERFEMDGMSAAELATRAYELRARIEAARAHFAGLVGEFLAQVETAAGA